MRLQAECTTLLTNSKRAAWLVTLACGVILSRPALAQLNEGKTEKINPSEEKRGLILNGPDAMDGYTLLVPMRGTRTYLLDNAGRIVNTWKSNYWHGCSAYLLPNGDLLRTAALVGPLGNPVFGVPGGGGRVQRFSWEGELLWDFKFSTEQYMSHHDVEIMPNGNVLILAWDRKTKEQSIAAGRNPKLLKEGELWPDFIVEVKPTGATDGEIVWRWNLWDHLVQDLDKSKSNYGSVEKSPGLLDMNFTGLSEGGANWPHSNALDYNADFDQIALSMHSTSEIVVLDHSTTTEQAAGHSGGKYGKGGDFLYRWGNPQVYRAGTAVDQKLFQQHDAQWISKGYPGEGNILTFNNGLERPQGQYSSIEMIVPPVDVNGKYEQQPGKACGPSEAAWTYVAKNPTDFYSSHISGAQRLRNGNTIIVSGSDGILFEVTPAGETVWKFLNPIRSFGVAPGEPGAEDSGRLPREVNVGLPPDGIPVRTGPYSVFNVERYPQDYPAFAGKKLTPSEPLSPLRTPKLRPKKAN